MIKISDAEYFSNDGTIRFLQMDCNEFMKGLKDNEFDLNLSDPPYGINHSTIAGKKSGTQYGKAAAKKKQYDIKDWDKEKLDKIVFDEIIKTSKNQIIWGANHFISKIPIDSPCWIVWDKDNGDSDFADCELALTSFKSAVRKIKYTWNGMIQQNMKNKQERIHPTEKPIDLYRWILQNYTKPTDTILDCFGGSMSNAIACHMERRKLTIIELDIDYFKSALKRFDFYERQLTLF